MANILYLTSMIIFIFGNFYMIASNSYFKKIIGLGVMQSGVLVFYIALGKIKNGIAPVNICRIGEICDETYSNPLPHVIILTAIVVGIATLSVGLSLIVKIKEEFGTINEDEIDD